MRLFAARRMSTTWFFTSACLWVGAFFVALPAAEAEVLFRGQRLTSIFDETANVSPTLPWTTAGRETEPEQEDYPHIFSTDVWNPNRFWYTERPNILNQAVSGDWDAMKIINTDRPDFTDVATVVGKGRTQLETGYTFRHRNDGVIDSNQNGLPEALLRVGVSDKLELRLKWDGYANAHVEHDLLQTGSTVQGYSDMTVGFKWAAIDQDNWRPLQTIVTRLTIPTGTSEFSARTVQPGFTYIYNWQIRRWWFLRGSSGADWLNRPGPVFVTDGTGGSTLPGVASQRDYQVQGHQSISSYMQIAKRLGMFAEYFVLYRTASSDNRPDNYHDYGLYYYVRPDFQLDIRIGQRLGNGRVQEMFTGAGVSVRF